jgi:hypothetical protein
MPAAAAAANELSKVSPDRPTDNIVRSLLDRLRDFADNYGGWRRRGQTTVLRYDYVGELLKVVFFREENQTYLRFDSDKCLKATHLGGIRQCGVSWPRLPPRGF